MQQKYDFLGLLIRTASQSDKSKLTLTDRNRQVRFEGSFEILRLYIFLALQPVFMKCLSRPQFQLCYDQFLSNFYLILLLFWRIPYFLK